MPHVSSQTPSTLDAPTSASAGHWPALVAQVGVEIAAPLTAAIEQINAALASGKIDRRGLRALRDEIERARQVGIMGQQLTRFAAGGVHQVDETLALDEMLTSVLAQAARRTLARGITVEPDLQPVQVRADASLLFGLLNTVLDWAMASADERIAFTIDVKPWPKHARIACRFGHAPSAGGGAADAGPDSIAWHLLAATAQAMGLVVDRRQVVGTTTLTIEFPRTVDPEAEGVTASEAIATTGAAPGGTPLNAASTIDGRHVLIVASRREMRVLIRDALRDLNLLLDIVGTVDEAAAFCRESMPDAVIIEAIQVGARFQAFRDEVAGAAPVFVEILEQGTTFELAGSTGAATSRVGRDVVASALPAALMFELSKRA
ncbi:hypothetical protein [Piscinibacter koreensis]|uniref:Uncharacterized protein n=1 Tax=Piscinibacter koreensis TaxID=2742824 RepID=A0A7Y6NKR4_9BURK|nr:hypothetical protein [Schlegelella koreensis]NUZ04886.1 hypothetical protein [Schlegelella koreensis]